MVIVGKLFQLLRYICHAGTNNISRQIARSNEQVQSQTYQSCRESSQQGIADGMDENLPSFLSASQICQGSNNCQGNGWHSNKLEKSGKYSSDKVKKAIERWNLEPSQHSTNDQGTEPQQQLLFLGTRAVLGHSLLGCLTDCLILIGHI